jgi:acyl-homoserine-lactone acylase
LVVEETPAPETPEAIPAPPLARAVEIRRTSYGVPHILGANLEAGAFGLAWVMMEDYGEVVPRQLLTANGRWATALGEGAVGGDYPGRMAHDYAVEVFPGFPSDVQAILRGFAAGVNYYIEVHRDELPDWANPEFTPEDVAARDLRVWDAGAVRNFLRDRQSTAGGRNRVVPPSVEVDPDAGSNAWAFGPERTTSGNAILVRNPHLSYTSGYYEAHLTVPGSLDFYGDFRLGGPFTIIGGFNERLGWSTTNNYGNPNQIYALLKSPRDPDAYRFGGSTEAIETRKVTVEYVDGDTLASASREFRFTPLGPVVFETPDTVFVLKTPALGQHRLGEQWLRMMQSENLEEWKEAMRIRAKYSSNFTYADADGNIFYVWNASIPILPHEPSDGAPVFAEGPEDVWSELYPWDDLPQLLNPQGGYVQNANDPPYFTNLNEIMDPEAFPPNFPEPRLRFRSQNSLELVHTDQVLSLEDVVELKHSMKMILADRVKDDLVRAVRSRNPSEEASDAIDLIETWDNRVARESRGATLFELWMERYSSSLADTLLFRTPWSMDAPATTPSGLGDEDFAALSFDWAVEEATRRFGSWDVAWGEVHRIRAGALDLPVGGCPSGLGCFRVIGFGQDEDGKYRARTGDAWVLAVEFGETPRAYSVLVYGNSNKEDSPYFYDQAELFANNRMKAVAFTEADIQADLVERYHPGEARHR